MAGLTRASRKSISEQLNDASQSVANLSLKENGGAYMHDNLALKAANDKLHSKTRLYEAIQVSIINSNNELQGLSTTGSPWSLRQANIYTHFVLVENFCPRNNQNRAGESGSEEGAKAE